MKTTWNASNWAYLSFGTVFVAIKLQMKEIQLKIKAKIPNSDGNHNDIQYNTWNFCF